MPDADGFYPPVAFSPWWVLLALAILALVTVGFVVILLATRTKKADDVAATARTPADYRAVYLAQIDAVGVAYRAGRIGSAEAHQQLSLAVREFAGIVRGIRAPYMTLADLRGIHVDPLADTVAELYPGAFAEGAHSSVAQAEARARELVGGWR